MEHKQDRNLNLPSAEGDGEDDELLQMLEHQTCCDGRVLFKYRGLWCSVRYLKTLLCFQKHLNADNIDAVLATSPKSGTTWLKALAFSIATRHIYAIDQSPLLTSNPHQLIRYLEIDVCWDQEDVENIPGPRIFSTHLLFGMLPDSIRESNCKIIYICRNPLDQFVSLHLFLLENKIQEDTVPLELDEACDKFCQGIHPQGPFWDHMLGYWNAHLKNPRKVLFLKYEDLKDDIIHGVKKIAEFLGLPFSMEEEKKGVIEQISSLCSFDKLRSLQVNKSGKLYGVMKKSSYFRKGEVGDWRNYLTPDMAQRINEAMETKLDGSGLTFKI